MGREIVRQESTLEPGRRSRLWFSDDIFHVLEENKGTDTIEVIITNLHKDRKVKWCGKAFGQMKNLRILIIRNAGFSIDPQILPNSLRVLDWSGYESFSLPFDFNPKNLVIHSLRDSCLKRFKSLNVFETLSFLDFEDCKFLTEIPSLSRVPNLKSLWLDYCTNLFKIHDSVGFLDKLVLLSAKGCIQLESLVPCMNLPSLEKLDLRGCSRLASFPEVLGVMENLKDVYLDETDLYQLPFTFGNLVGLQRLFLRSCQRMIQIPSYVLPKVEIVTSHHRRGVRSSNDAAKVSPKVSANAMCVYNEYGKSFLNVYSLNVSSNNVIEVCSPSWNQDEHKLKNMGYSLFCHPIHRRRVIMDKVRSNEPSVHLWFRKKFPRIALCCFFETGESFDNMVLDFKLNVLINGTKQLSTSCVYMFYRKRKTDQKFFCDLQCNMDGRFSENEWNHVEIVGMSCLLCN
ncbi:probable WRKY transcription factor 19 [Medicago truncatula]|nr:probable WRKY transcription factor 19 [Medicago truncatula]